MKHTDNAGGVGASSPSWHPGQIRVLHALHLARRASRIELSARTELSPQSVTRITQELISGGFVRELARRHTGSLGQPAIELGLAPGRLLSLGLVLEHDRITCVTSDLAAGVIRRVQSDGDFLSAEKCAEMSERLVSEALEALPPGATLIGLGVSQPGFFFDLETRRMVNRGDIEGWVKLDLANYLRERFQIEVETENDGCAAAAGHLIHGVGTKFGSFFLVYITRGLGGGAVHDRQLIRGRAGNAGAIGMLLPPNTPGSARPTLDNLTEFLSKGWGTNVTAKSIDQALTRQDPILESWLAQAATLLNNALTNVCAILDPEAVIIAGRLPYAVRAELAARIHLLGVSFEGISAPSPHVVVDPDSDCLELGASALPVTRFFDQHEPRPGRTGNRASSKLRKST